VSKKKSKRAAPVTMAAARNHASLIEDKNLRFLITDCPSDASMDSYVKV
jgi:hypothetical protein